MKGLATALPAMVALTLPQLASAQTSSPTGNNPTTAGVYMEGMLGVNFQSETDLDFDDSAIVDASIDPNTGFLGSLAVGYNLPQGSLNVRMEGELSVRANEVEEIEFDSGAVIDLEDADTSSIAGMVNAHLDFYVIPGLALTAGAGIGYANVNLDFAVIDDSASGFAYQGRLGARYSFTQNSTVSLGYTYFATTELEVEDQDDDELSFDYTNHGLHLGYAFHF